MPIAFPLKSRSPRCNGVLPSALTLHSKVCSEKREGTLSGSNRERSRRDWTDVGIRTCFPKLTDSGSSFHRQPLLSLGSYPHRGWHYRPLTFEVADAAMHQAVARHRCYHWW